MTESLTEQQRNYIESVNAYNKIERDLDDPEQLFGWVVYNLFRSYLMVSKERDKENVAVAIWSIRQDLKERIKIWHILGDYSEFVRLVNQKVDRGIRIDQSAQARRHEKRDDFALSPTEWRAVVKHFDNECVYCGTQSKLTYDHFYPFSKGGDFMKGNIVPACQSCNSSKQAHEFKEWYHKKSYYDEEREKKLLKYIDSNKQLTLL